MRPLSGSTIYVVHTYTSRDGTKKRYRFYVYKRGRMVGITFDVAAIVGFVNYRFGAGDIELMSANLSDVIYALSITLHGALQSALGIDNRLTLWYNMVSR